MPSAIKLTRGYYALVDEEDFAVLDQYKWNFDGHYAARNVKCDGRWRPVHMHRVIMQPMDGLDVDHINGNKIDNRKLNLRIVTHQFNMQNLHPKKPNKYGAAGIAWDRHNHKFTASIRVNYKAIWLGRYSTVEEAIKVRKAAEAVYFSEETHDK